MAAFIGPLNCCGHQRYAELPAALELDHAQAVEEALEEAVEEVYGRVYRLMKPAKFLRRPRRSYDVTVGDHIVHVGVQKKCFIIRRSPPPWLVAGTG